MTLQVVILEETEILKSRNSRIENQTGIVHTGNPTRNTGRSRLVLLLACKKRLPSLLKTEEKGNIAVRLIDGKTPNKGRVER
jgi:hypothetical protein